MPLPAKNSSIFVHLLVLALTCIIFISAINTIRADWDRAQLKSLDNLRPKTFKYLYPQLDPARLKIYEIYFERVEQHLGYESPEAFGLQGYCAYQRGDLRKSEEFYKKALSKNPKFFWYYYNLGIIYLRQQEYAQALSMFQSALNLDLKESFVFIVSSNRIYMPIVSSYMPDLQHDLIHQLEEGQQVAMQLAMFAKLKTENPKLEDAPANLLKVMCY